MMHLDCRGDYSFLTCRAFFFFKSMPNFFSLLQNEFEVLLVVRRLHIAQRPKASQAVFGVVAVPKEVSRLFVETVRS